MATALPPTTLPTTTAAPPQPMAMAGLGLGLAPIPPSAVASTARAPGQVQPLAVPPPVATAAAKAAAPLRKVPTSSKTLLPHARHRAKDPATATPAPSRLPVARPAPATPTATTTPTPTPGSTIGSTPTSTTVRGSATPVQQAAVKAKPRASSRTLLPLGNKPRTTAVLAASVQRASPKPPHAKVSKLPVPEPTHPGVSLLPTVPGSSTAVHVVAPKAAHGRSSALPSSAQQSGGSVGKRRSLSPTPGPAAARRGKAARRTGSPGSAHRSSKRSSKPSTKVAVMDGGTHAAAAARRKPDAAATDLLPSLGQDHLAAVASGTQRGAGGAGGANPRRSRTSARQAHKQSKAALAPERQYLLSDPTVIPKTVLRMIQQTFADHDESSTEEVFLASHSESEDDNDEEEQRIEQRLLELKHDFSECALAMKRVERLLRKHRGFQAEETARQPEPRPVTPVKPSGGGRKRKRPKPAPSEPAAPPPEVSAAPTGTKAASEAAPSPPAKEEAAEPDTQPEAPPSKPPPRLAATRQPAPRVEATPSPARKSPSGAKIYACDLCERTFTHPPAYAQHRRSHNSSPAPSKDGSPTNKGRRTRAQKAPAPASPPKPVAPPEPTTRITRRRRSRSAAANAAQPEITVADSAAPESAEPVKGNTRAASDTTATGTAAPQKEPADGAVAPPDRKRRKRSKRTKR